MASEWSKLTDKQREKAAEKRPDGMPRGTPFQKGQPSPNPKGRPPKWDFRKVLEEAAKDGKTTPEEWLSMAIRALVKKADKGDVQAIKLLIDRMCDLQAQALKHEGGVNIEMVSGVPQKDDADDADS